MPKGKRSGRHSRAGTPTLIRDPKKRARREARNALRQFDLALDIVKDYLDKRRPFRLNTSHVLLLHKEALEGISLFAGTYRNTPIKIGHSKHVPPEAHLVPMLTQEMEIGVRVNLAAACSAAARRGGGASWRSAV